MSQRIYELALVLLIGSYLQAIGFWQAAISLGHWLVWDLWAWLVSEIKAWWNTEDDDAPPGSGPAPAV